MGSKGRRLPAVVRHPQKKGPESRPLIVQI
jgi:hypothetical protein